MRFLKLEALTPGSTKTKNSMKISQGNFFERKMWIWREPRILIPNEKLLTRIFWKDKISRICHKKKTIFHPFLFANGNDTFSQKKDFSHFSQVISLHWESTNSKTHFFHHFKKES